MTKATRIPLVTRNTHCDTMHQTKVRESPTMESALSREAGGDGVLVGRVEQEQVADFGTDRPAPFQCDATAFGGNAGGWYRPEN